MKSAPASARAAASAAVEGNTSNRAYTCTSAVMPYGVNPVNLTSVGTFSSRMPSVALLTTSSARRSTSFRSLPAATVNGTGTYPSDACVSFSSDDVLSTELGMTI